MRLRGHRECQSGFSEAASVAEVGTGGKGGDQDSRKHGENGEQPLHATHPPFTPNIGIPVRVVEEGAGIDRWLP